MPPKSSRARKASSTRSRRPKSTKSRKAKSTRSKTPTLAAGKKPKRAPSAYNLFIKKTMPGLIRDNQHLEQCDRMKLAAEMWNKQKR